MVPECCSLSYDFFGVFLARWLVYFFWGGRISLRWEQVDDCWANWNRSAGGKLVPNSTRFPSGMATLAKYVHDKGAMTRYHCAPFLPVLLLQI